MGQHHRMRRHVSRCVDTHVMVKHQRTNSHTHTHERTPGTHAPFKERKVAVLEHWHKAVRVELEERLRLDEVAAEIGLHELPVRIFDLECPDHCVMRTECWNKHTSRQTTIMARMRDQA